MADNSASSSAAAGLPKQRTLDKWIEPALPEPVPSYKDRPSLNIPPFGVLSNMAPLGTPPNSKMQKMAKAETNSRIRPKNGGASASSVSTPMEETMTPDPLVNPSTIRRSESHQEEVMDCPPPVTPPTVRVGTAASPAVNGTGPNLQRIASQPAYTPRAPMSGPRPTTGTSSIFTSTNMTRPPPRLEAVVLSAIRSARGANRQHTAFALTDLITHHRDDPNVERVLRAVASSEGNIDASLQAEFSTMVQQKKRESRRKGLPDRRLSSSFSGAGIRFATPSYNSPSKIIPAVPDSLPEQPSASRSPSKRPSTSPNKEYAHVNKKLKSNNFEEDNHTDMANPILDTNGSSMPASLSGASRSSSPLSELDELEDLLLADTHFQHTEPTKEERTSITEINARVRPASKRKSKVDSAPKLHTSLANSSRMAVAASPSPSSSAFPSNNNNAKSHKKNASSVQQKLDPNDARELLRRKARGITQSYDFSYSDIRDSLNLPEIESESEDAESSIATSRPAGPSGLRLRLRNIGTKVPANDESDKSSPTFLPFQHELAPTSSIDSRQSTPNTFGRPTRKAKTGPRVKTSPMKNRAVPLAGISRASGERNSPVGNGGFGSNQDDNHDDYCSSCGGGGMIVCCDGDGCRRSYHWLCLDPPRKEEDVDTTESVFCCSCTAAMRTATKRTPGLFASLLNNIERKNPVAFRLTKDISEYFEGVRTGLQGEYEEILPARSSHKNRAGYEEAPDYLRLKDGKGNTILCHKCQRSAASGQPIIGCAFCSLQWHLDCLDPPLANPPNKDRPWKCPCHVEDLLEKIPGMLGPAHKYRKIKGASAMRPRSVRNNGHIEIENSPSDDEDDASGFYTQNSFGREYRLPERGVKLDFITRVKRDNMQDNMRGPKRRKLAATEEPSAPPPPTESLGSRPIHEQQAALNLGLLASTTDDLHENDKISGLVTQLLAQAPDAVVKMVAHADATKLADREEGALASMRSALIALLQTVDELSGSGKGKQVDGTEESGGGKKAEGTEESGGGGTATIEKQVPVEDGEVDTDMVL